MSRVLSYVVRFAASFLPFMELLLFYCYSVTFPYAEPLFGSKKRVSFLCARTQILED